MSIAFALSQKLMAGLTAEMRHINDGGGIIRENLQDFTSSQRLEPFAGFQDGQGAQQADGIKGGRGVMFIHKAQISIGSRPVHKDVTIAPRDLLFLLF